MSGLSCFIIVLFLFGTLAYHRASLIVWGISFALLSVFFTKFNGFSVSAILTALFFLLVLLPLSIKPLRKKWFTQHLLRFYQQVMPAMSRTEKEAIKAGTVTWEGDLFRGDPDWNKLIALPSAKLTQEEQAFIDGPVETLCKMLNDWDITHNRADLPTEV